jgi:hypothetical protein
MLSDKVAAGAVATSSSAADAATGRITSPAVSHRSQISDQQDLGCVEELVIVAPRGDVSKRTTEVIASDKV